MLILLVAGLLFGLLEIVKPFATPILFGGTLATAAWPLRQALVRHGIGRGLAAALLFVLSLLLLLVPMLVIAPHLADQLTRATESFEAYFGAAPAKPAWIEGLPLIGRRVGAGWDQVVKAEGDVRTLIAPYTSHVEQWLIG